MRAPRVHRGARRAFAVIVLLVVALGVALAAAVLRDGSDQAYEDPHQPVPADSTTCGANPVREQCLDIAVPGAGTFRYSFLKSPEPTADTVIVDFGGPGLAILSGTANLGGFQTEYPALAKRYNLLFLEEPWVIQTPPDGCDTAMTAFYRAVRQDTATIAGTGRSLARACGLAMPEFAVDGTDHAGFGLDPAKYPRVIDAIADRHSLRIKGFVARSWGSVRLAYLADIDLEFAVLVRPFPVGADGLTLQRDQAEVIRNTMPSSLRPVRTAEITSRSLPINHVDQLSAVVELGYVDDEYFDATAQSVLRGENLTEVGRLSDELWSRYGRETLSPAKLAQWQEICGTVPRPLPAVPAKIESTADLLAANFAPCHSLHVHTPSHRAARQNCIVTSPLDTVTPERLIRERYASILDERLTWHQSRQRSHASLDGLAECLDVVLP